MITVNVGTCMTLCRGNTRRCHLSVLHTLFCFNKMTPCIGAQAEDKHFVHMLAGHIRLASDTFSAVAQS